MDVSELLPNNVSGSNDEDLPATQMVDNRVLKGVTAYVEVRSTSDNRSEAIRRELVLLGASVEKKFTNDVTHVVFKEGSNRTKSKAQKKGIHLVSVLWVENCKLNQEHVSERMYPAVVPKLNGTPLLMTKLKKAKSMQPKDFEEELASSAERVGRKRKKLQALNSLRGSECTPSNSPYLGAILVQDTQPHSQEEGFVLTPVRLTIPDTPPSMREKLKQLRLAKAEAAGSYTNSDLEDDLDSKEINFKQLQKNLFKRYSIDEGNCSSTCQSPNDVSSILSLDKDDEGSDNENIHDAHFESKSNGDFEEVFDLGDGSQSSVNNDVLSIAKNINATLKNTSEKSVPHFFGFDSDENLLNSQEIKTVANVTVKLKPNKDNDTKLNDKQTTNELGDINTKSDDSNDRRPGERNCSSADAGKDNEVENIKQRKSRRSSRRMSVQQALQSLNQTGLLDLVPEDEDPLPKSPRGNIPNLADVLSDTSEMGNPSERKSDGSDGMNRRSPRNKRSAGGTKNESCSDNQNKRKSQGNTVRNKKSCRDSDGNETISKLDNTRKKSCDSACEQQHEDVVDKPAKKITNNSKGKKTMKKKLMSLTELNDQHSVLIEPSTCSEVNRPQLMEESMNKTSRKGRRRKTNIVIHNCDEINADNDQTIIELNQTTKNRRGRKRKSADNELNDDYNESSVNKKPGRGRRKAKSGRTSTLVNDTLIEHKSPKTTTASGPDCAAAPVTKIQDVSTELSLTKDNSVVCSIRETTLSLSMSAAYTEANMPSFLASQRRSIDEFSASQKRRKKQSLVEKSVLTSIGESLYSDHNKSDSDTSSVDGGIKMKSFRSGKLFRPSFVMTSLHSCEQDVVISVVKKLGGFIIAENVNETTTHLVCGEPRRTLNVLRCLARGIWLVTKEWVITSLEKGKWVPEIDFEYTSAFPTCKIARLEREKCNSLYRQSLFSNVGPMYVSGQSQPPRSHLVQLIKLCGGQVVNIKEKANLYVGSDFHPGMTCVKTLWLLDSIANHVQMPMDMYYLDRPKKESSPEY